MANKKFSQFTAGAAYNPTNDGLARIAGFTTGTTVNNIWTPSEIATGLNLTNALQNIYNTDGTILTGVDRNVDLAGTGTLQFTGVVTQGDFRIGSAAIGGRSNWAIRQTGDVIEEFFYQSNHYAGSNSDISAAGYKTGVNYLSVSAQGLEHHKVSVGIGVNGTVNDRLVAQGADQSNTKYTARFLDGLGNDLFILRNDGVAKFSGQAYTELHTGITNMTFNWNDGNVQSTTMAGGTNPTFIPTNPKAGATYILSLAQSGAETVNWNSLVKWPAATAPTLSGTGKTDVITLICYNETGAGLYYGSFTLNFTT